MLPPETAAMWQEADAAPEKLHFECTEQLGQGKSCIVSGFNTEKGKVISQEILEIIIKEDI